MFLRWSLPCLAIGLGVVLGAPPAWGHGGEHDDGTPGGALSECLETLREKAEDCREAINEKAEHCVERIRELLEEGKLEDAAAEAEACLARIEEKREQCLADLEEACERCREVLLERFPTDGVLNALEQACQRMKESVQATASGAMARVRLALQAPPPPSGERYAKECLKELRHAARACIEEIRKLRQTCLARIAKLLGEGKTEEAEALAESCIAEIHAHTDACLDALEDLCARCVDVLTREFNAPDLAEEVVEACEEWMEEVVEAETEAVEAIEEALEEPPNEDSATVYAEECLKALREIVHDCLDDLADFTKDCLETIRERIEAGDEEGAKEAALRCAAEIEERITACIQLLTERCEECAAVLIDQYGADDLAERIRIVCTELIDFLERAEARAIQILRDAANEPTPPDPAEEFARQCAEEIRALAERCVHELRNEVTACAERIKELLEAGEVEAAQAEAEACLETLSEKAQACLAEIEAHCARCVEALRNDYGADALADRLAGFCADQTEFIRNALRRAERALEELFESNEAGEFARECLRAIRAQARVYVEQNQRTSVWCAQRVLRLIDAGEPDKARDVAERCIERISANTRAAAQSIRDHCERCVNRLLEEFNAPELAERLRQACADELEHLFQSERRAIHLIRLALNTEPLPETDELGERGFAPLVRGDVTLTGDVNSVDVQFVINKTLGANVPEYNRYDMDDDEDVTAVDIQLVIKALLGVD